MAIQRDRPFLIRSNDDSTPPGPPTAGMQRRVLVDDGERWAGWFRTDPGVAGGWHHHGERDSYIYIVRGTIVLEFGPGGRESLTAGPGDFVFNPAKVIHREITGADEAVEGYVVRVGRGPHVVNVAGPDLA